MFLIYTMLGITLLLVMLTIEAATEGFTLKYNAYNFLGLTIKCLIVIALWPWVLPFYIYEKW